MGRITLSIATAERETYSGEADYVVAPSTEGQVTILPRHAALMTTLMPGELRFRNDDGLEQSIALAGGFMEVLNDQVTILADAAERADEIDLQRADEAIQRARQRIASHAADVDIERALASMRRGQTRVRIARRVNRRDDANLNLPQR